MSADRANTYKIINVEHSNSAVDLVQGNPYATVSGYSNNDTPFQMWILRKINDTDKFILESSYARGSFVSAYFQVDGAPLFASPNPTVWIRELVYGTTDKYLIKTTDGKYAWFLPEGLNFLTILLRPAGQLAYDKRAQWRFENI